MTIRTKVPVTRYDLNSVAERIKVHPRTILRALSGVENTYWSEDHNPDVDLMDLVLAYDVDFIIMTEVMTGKDDLLKTHEAAHYLSMTYGKEISIRVIRSRSYTPAIHRPKVVRYSRLLISRQHVELYEK